MKLITSRRNPLIVHMKKLAAEREYRRKCGEFICDGMKLFKEAISSGAEITCVLAEPGTTIPDDMPSYEVPRDIIESVSQLKNPQNIIFSCKIPAEQSISYRGRNIILENVQDPGNTGTVIRSAGAFYIDSVILLGKCADPYSPKTARATMGAIFRQRIIEADLNDIKCMRAGGVTIYGASTEEGCSDIRDVSLNNCAVCIGNEGRGLSDELLNLCDRKVIIPMNNACESLNAGIAASLIMWEMMRRDRY